MIRLIDKFCYSHTTLHCMAQCSSGGVAISYVFPVLYITSYLYVRKKLIDDALEYSACAALGLAIHGVQ